MQIKLRREGKLVYVSRFSSSAEIEFLREEGGEANERHRLSSVPITVSLLLKHGVAEDYKIVIKQINGSRERVLFSGKLQKPE